MQPTTSFENSGSLIRCGDWMYRMLRGRPDARPSAKTRLASGFHRVPRGIKGGQPAQQEHQGRMAFLDGFHMDSTSRPISVGSVETTVMPASKKSTFRDGCPCLRPATHSGSVKPPVHVRKQAYGINVDLKQSPARCP